jgi:predicted  nucleic acid-binding Zn-ribbon protein
MASGEVRRLWNLHVIDSEIHEIKRKAAVFSPGKEIADRIAALEKQLSEVEAEHKRVHAEQTDLQLQLKTLRDKVQRVNKEIYGGAITNSREVEALQKDLVATEAQIVRSEASLADRSTELQPIEARLAEIRKELEGRRKQFEGARKEGIAARKQMETRYSELNAMRPEVAKLVNPSLIARYEGIRNRHGTGMSKIKGQNCSGCGTVQSEKIILSTQEERLTTCSECGRILYYSEGII